MDTSPQSLTRRELIRHLTLLSAAEVLQRRPCGLRMHRCRRAPFTRRSPSCAWVRKIAILVYPEFTALDAMGPHHPLAGMMGATVNFVAEDPGHCPGGGASRGGFCIKPQWSFADRPSDLDLLLVPGESMARWPPFRTMPRWSSCRPRVQGKTRRQFWYGVSGSGRCWVAQGRRATSHWQTLELFREVGATPVAERIVFDGDDRDRRRGQRRTDLDSSLFAVIAATSTPRASSCWGI